MDIQKGLFRLPLVISVLVGIRLALLMARK
jgi:hypothetical protein